MEIKKMKVEGQIVLNYTIIEEIECDNTKGQQMLHTQLLVENEDYQAILSKADLIGIEEISIDISEYNDGDK